ncbi:MAG: hypothetical protein BGO39_15550 [Chloroflexi bacterium 54-19]|nr:MAG: hypothetical protein BGO39_15550 [Chloroflexi bacterium 54-19]
MLNKIFCSMNSIKWLLNRGKRALALLVAKAAAVLAMVVFTTSAAFAQGIDTGKIKQASQSIISAIQSICGIGIALLLVAGFGLFMWSGVSDTFRIRSLRIIGFSIMGGALLFLFAQPLADFLTGTFGATS